MRTRSQSRSRSLADLPAGSGSGAGAGSERMMTRGRRWGRLRAANLLAACAGSEAIATDLGGAPTNQYQSRCCWEVEAGRPRKQYTARFCGGQTEAATESEWRDWANLPSELIEDIAGRLHSVDVSEYLRFRSACSPGASTPKNPVPVAAALTVASVPATGSPSPTAHPRRVAPWSTSPPVPASRSTTRSSPPTSTWALLRWPPRPLSQDQQCHRPLQPVHRRHHTFPFPLRTCGPLLPSTTRPPVSSGPSTSARSHVQKRTPASSPKRSRWTSRRMTPLLSMVLPSMTRPRCQPLCLALDAERTA